MKHVSKYIAISKLHSVTQYPWDTATEFARHYLIEDQVVPRSFSVTLRAQRELRLTRIILPGLGSARIQELITVGTVQFQPRYPDLPQTTSPKSFTKVVRIQRKHV